MTRRQTGQELFVRQKDQQTVPNQRKEPKQAYTLLWCSFRSTYKTTPIVVDAKEHFIKNQLQKVACV